VVIIKLFFTIILIALLARAVLKIALSLLPRKPAPQKRYNDPQSAIDEKDIVDGEYEEIK